MKKLFLVLISILILYIISIFTFPKYADYVGGVLGIAEINHQIREKKNQFDEQITSYDIFGNIRDTKQKVFEVKQNVSSGIIQTQQKIEEVKIGIHETRDALNQTMDSIDKTLDAFGNLKNTVSGGSTHTSFSGETTLSNTSTGNIQP